MKYFVSPDLQDLLFREKKALDARKKLLDLVKGQTLIIFPDNWTRYHMLDGVVGVDRSPSCLQLFSTDTQNRKDLNWRTIKKGGASMIVATHSEVFQPFIALKKIILVDSHKWYYHNQQDPRYSLSTVVKKMAEIYGAEVIEVKNVGKLAFEI
jgi:primosomal protein N'